MGIFYVFFTFSVSIEYKKPAEAEPMPEKIETKAKPVPKKAVVKRETITDTYKLSVIQNILTINWRTSADVVKTCNVDPALTDADSVDACADIYNSVIEMSFEKKGKEFQLYHELGHIIYRLDFPRDIFKSSVLSPDYEQIAEDFAWWIEGQEHKSEAEFVKSILSADEIKYFEQTCNSVCVNEILSIKIR